MEEEVDQIQEQQQMDDSDDDENSIFGYQQLPQEDDNENVYGQLVSDDDEESQVDIKVPLQIEMAKSDQLQPGKSAVFRATKCLIS
jgi:hypothetical protein